MVSLSSLKISLPRIATVLIFFTAGLLSLVLRARRLLGAYRIPRRPAFSSHLVNAVVSMGRRNAFLGVYSQESENLKFVVGVDLSAALLCSDPTGNSRLGLCSSGSIVVRARLCFRSSRVARGSADHRSRLSHPWLP